jgi:hypothetical protein
MAQLVPQDQDQLVPLVIPAHQVDPLVPLVLLVQLDQLDPLAESVLPQVVHHQEHPMWVMFGYQMLMVLNMFTSMIAVLTNGWNWQIQG